MRSTWPNRRHLADSTFSLMGRHRQRRYCAVFEMRCGQWMPMIWRRWRRWYASRRSSSAFVRPHVPMLYTNTGTTKESYSRIRNSRLIRDRLNHTVDSLRKATFASCFRRATSSASPSSDPSLRVMRKRGRKGNYKEIWKSLALMDWNDKMKNKTATECWNSLRGELDSAIDSYVPMKKQGKRSKKKHLSK